jgi:hypothetical protein
VYFHVAAFRLWPPQLHPNLAGVLLSRDPAEFQSPEGWLRRELYWDEPAVADALLSDWQLDLYSLDEGHAAICTKYLSSLGLSHKQIGQLLKSNPGLLTLPATDCELSGWQNRSHQLSLSWQTSEEVAAAALLAQPWLTAGIEERTGQLLHILQVQPCLP